jgi:hypothetical protein
MTVSRAGRGDGATTSGASLRRLAGIVAIGLACAGCAATPRRPAPEPAIVARVAEYGPTARARLAPFFAAAGVHYPPPRFVLVGFKLERELHLIAPRRDGRLAFIRSYPVLGASGTLGPKLHEGDLQVPEGVYAIAYVNPNSVAHLSLALDYPNEDDRARAAEDGREQLGGDIMIHGGATSHGCLAIGDDAAEELFVLAVDAGWENAVVVITPVDFRERTVEVDPVSQPRWLDALYATLRAELAGLPRRPAAAVVVAPDEAVDRTPRAPAE